MINLYLLGEKGYNSLRVINKDYLHLINSVIIGRDKNVLNDFSKEIIDYCKKLKIDYFIQNKTLDSNSSEYSIAIGWRWLINDNTKLLIFHDSILPRLRGFNPLVTALINGDEEIGVSVLFGTEEFDRGEIIIQKKIKVEYPIKIKEAIEIISNLYGHALNELLSCVKLQRFSSNPQDESIATYSLWRDEQDYKIDWNKSANYINRFINAVGYPYKGAFAIYKNSKYYIKDSIVVDDVIVENRTPGKVLFKNVNGFFVVCGDGLLCIKDFFDEDGQNLDVSNFRIRFE